MTEKTQELVRLHVELDPLINFAMQQNDVPIVKSLRIENISPVPLRDVEVNVSSDPDFCMPWTVRIASLGESEIFQTDVVDLKLSPEFLYKLTERIEGLLQVSVLSENNLIAKSIFPVSLLARDEWGGTSSLPEILAAFVTPNHPAIGPILKGASDLLGKWTGNPSLDGYQSKNQERAYLIGAAIYEALAHLRIKYVNPPASFGKEGQRLRLTERILQEGMGTCIDLALLAASCLEQAGLNPLVLLSRDHAFAGCWTQEECFAESVIDDALQIRKHSSLKDLVVFDATCLTTSISFQNAIHAGDRHLVNDHSFQYAIDVGRARKSGIRPLPELTSLIEVLSSSSHPKSKWSDIASKPSSPSFPVGHATSGPGKSPASRVDTWCRKLLDLSLRNRLLNFKDSKKSVDLLCPDLAALEDLFANGKSLKISPLPPLFAQSDPRDPVLHEHRTGRDAIASFLTKELESKRLYSKLQKEELDSRCVAIYRAANLALQEGGASALYVAFGFLAWNEKDNSTQRHLAPLILVPVGIHRKSVGEGFTLKVSDEEPRINVTLLEMLKQDFGLTISGLDPLPTDDAGLDVKQIFDAVRQAVLNIKRWEVLEEAKLGFFSFAKFLMWRDLSARTNDLTKNKLVDHLVKLPGRALEPDAGFPEPQKLDDEHKPLDTFCPLPADSSQLAAVFAAAAGRTFVLKGPPGTGKSQTITNLISQCLIQGKTVLFVSEKIAALNVVHSRLKNIGLERFCLELHSNKIPKKDVSKQLAESLHTPNVYEDEHWKANADQLERLRGNLNEYVRALHKKRSSGETVFQVTSRLIRLNGSPKVNLKWPLSDKITPSKLADLRDLVSRLSTASYACGDLQNHVWRSLDRSEWSLNWENSVYEAIGTLNDSLEKIRSSATTCAQQLGLRDHGWSLNDLNLMKDITQALLFSPSLSMGLLVSDDWAAIEKRVTSWINLGQSRDTLRADVRKDFREEVMQMDLDNLRTLLVTAEASIWPISWWRRRPVRKALNSVSINGPVPVASMLDALRRARALRAEQRKLDEASEDARTLLGQAWNSGNAEWNEVARLRDWAAALRRLAARVAEDPHEQSELRKRWSKLSDATFQAPYQREEQRQQFESFTGALDAYKADLSKVVGLLEIDAKTTWGSDDAPNLPARVEAILGEWISARKSLKTWCAWRRARLEGVRNNLSSLIEGYESGEIPGEKLSDVFEHSYADWWLASVSEKEPVLNEFTSPEHHRKIAKFRAVDDEYLKLTQQIVQARLNHRVQASTSAADLNKELSILHHEANKKIRHKPVRWLLQNIPKLLTRVKPCLLMSPMSIAQYLDSAEMRFDVVVFDEASQIPVWDAIGAIARGRQAVIVGDPKQLPPTSFFQKSGDSDEGDDVTEDLESILDDCIGAQIPQLTLDWHYRSRHESLIAFSNNHYYENKLLTFPSPALTGLGVSWKHVADGCYDKGKTRSNEREARAVVQEIRRRIRDKASQQYSIGIVTFSQAQQVLIEDLLDQEREKDPEFDAYFDEDKLEPIFVKNLENVQGDERDVILFSICYGPDSNGNVSLNFGPLNRPGGERRLNVAITRARREVVVFSTLKADAINLRKTNSTGVAHLKSFLEYAERGHSREGTLIQPGKDSQTDRPFEDSVCDALTQKGWVVHKQVGCANYRIDLAVVDPTAKDRYLLGIECDGENYNRAHIARDRDKLRPDVLKDLGWKLRRVWSTDWLNNPEAETSKLLQALEQLRPAIPAIHKAAIKTTRIGPGSDRKAEKIKPISVVDPLTNEIVDKSQNGHAVKESDFDDESISNCVLQTVLKHGQIHVSELINGTASSLGFQPPGDKMRERIRSAVRDLVYKRVLIQAGDLQGVLKAAPGY